MRVRFPSPAPLQKAHKTTVEPSLNALLHTQSKSGPICGSAFETKFSWQPLATALGVVLNLPCINPSPAPLNSLLTPNAARRHALKLSVTNRAERSGQSHAAITEWLPPPAVTRILRSFARHA